MIVGTSDLWDASQPRGEARDIRNSDALRLHSGPIVGRRLELTTLVRRAEAAYSGRSSVAFVVGEPGIGKTRLVDEVAHYAAREGARVLRGRAPRVGAHPMRPFVEALLGLAREGWSPPESLGPYRAVLGECVPDWRTDGVRSPTATAPHFIGEAILRVFDRPPADVTMLILEDLHDADSETIGVLEYLVDNAVTQPLAIVCTAQDIPCAALDLAEYAQRRDPQAVIPLRRLTPSDAAELAAGLLGTDRDLLSDELLAVLVKDGVGSPFLITEILRDLISSRDLVFLDRGWTAREPERLRAPRSLARGVAEFVRRANPAVRKVLRAAAVLGEEFPADLVSAAARVQGTELWAALDSLVRDHYLVPAARDGWFAVRHPLLERAVVDQLGAAPFKDLARVAAEAIEEHGPATEEWQIRAALLRESGGDITGAGNLFATAGRAAAANGSPALAADALGRALACFPPDRRDTTWAELTGLLVTMLGLTGRYDEAFSYVDEVFAAHRAGLPSLVAAELHIRFARLALRAGRQPDFVASHMYAIRQALAETAASAQRAEVVAIATFVGLNTYASHHSPEVESLALTAIETAHKLALPAVECDALLALTYHYGFENLERALACCREAVRVARENNLTAQRCEALVILGAKQLAWELDPTGLQTAVREASAVGAVMETRFAQLSLALGAILRGEFDTAEAIVAAAYEDIPRLRIPRLVNYALAVKAILHAHRGDDDDLAGAVAAFDVSRGAADDEAPMVRGLAQGMSALLRGDVAAACAHFDELRELDTEARITKYFLCGEYGLSLLAKVVMDRAGWTQYDAVTAHVAGGIPWNRQFLEFARAVLAGRDGDIAEAERSFELALATAKPFPLARHLAVRLVSPSAARDGWGRPALWLNQAEAYFRDADLRAAARCCRDELRRLGAPTRQWRAGSPNVPQTLWIAGVTAREYEVLQLVAQRRTNREIAAELHLSHRTVERHVASLLAKTGSANRRELEVCQGH